MSKDIKEEALRYHSEGRAGKVEVIPTNRIQHNMI